ncbi:PHB depolymerase family esterase [Paucibacter sp. JuS9]|uniref:extracellular catalytic domain type 1 short-chain-length polyhydroxyalkanoate depolymerase n=1 Tax=Paucibacter sp. JuS9 TaxID=3228748 RepID=UPI003756C441
MNNFLRYLLLGLLGLFALLAVLAGLFGYFVYTPDPAQPQLSGTLAKGSIDMSGVTRRYRLYVPKNLPKGAPLVVVMHGSGEDAQRIRAGTGYGFDRLADQHGFAVVYPKSFGFSWNDCSVIGDVKVNGVSADDASFVAAMVDKLVGEIGIDPARVFATGVSSGGSMAIRLALEHPTRYRAVAAVAANLPTPQNFQCQPAANGTSVMIMNGTRDPLVPYEGGEINLLGLFYEGGPVMSSRASAQYFADWNHLGGAPQVSHVDMDEGVRVERARWHKQGKNEVELVSIHGGGHGLPQAYAQRPRLLGPSPMQPDGPAMIWDFFARQQR